MDDRLLNDKAPRKDNNFGAKTAVTFDQRVHGVGFANGANAALR